MRLRTGLGALVALALLSGLGTTIVARTGARPARVGHNGTWKSVSIDCRSPALGGTLPAQVYLPPHWGAGGRHYRVLYFLHGLPADPSAYKRTGFVAHELGVNGLQAIVVTPQGARDEDSDREYLDWSRTENWPRAISHDLTSCIDHRYPTVNSRRGRALIGLSAGGYGAMNIGLRNLDTFAVIESWSGYFVATDPSGLHVLKLSTAKAQEAATVPSGDGLRRSLRRHPTLVGFYVGRADSRFLTMNRMFDATLAQHGVPHVFRTYPGGHELALWQAEAPAWLRMALTYLRTSRVVAPAPGAR
jgi:enterochelin esterase-like enzyme